MKKFSWKTLLWILFGFVAGYFAGQIIGALLGTILWAAVGGAFGGLAYQSTGTIVLNTILSVAFGVLLAYVAWNFDKRLFGSKTSFLVWGLVGTIAGLIVMFTYGINFISRPEVHWSINGLEPIYEEIFDINQVLGSSTSVSYLSPLQYGGVTGHLIGIYVGIFAGLFISVRETIGRRQTPKDRKEFDEYSKFLNEQIRK